MADKADKEHTSNWVSDDPYSSNYALTTNKTDGYTSNYDLSTYNPPVTQNIPIQSSDLSNEKPVVFLSYNWTQKDYCRKINGLLKTKISTWLDIEQINGGDYLYDVICKGIYYSKVFVCCLSPEYIVSDSCFKEVNLALMYKKPVIPLVVSNIDNRFPTAVDALIAGKLYKDFKDENKISTNCNELIDNIRKILNSISQASKIQTLITPNPSYHPHDTPNSNPANTTNFPSYNLEPLFKTLEQHKYYKAALKAFMKRFGWRANEFINNNRILEDIYNHFGREWDSKFFEIIIKLLKEGYFYYPVKEDLKDRVSNRQQGFLIKHSTAKNKSFTIQYSFEGKFEKTNDFSYDPETRMIMDNKNNYFNSLFDLLDRVDFRINSGIGNKLTIPFEIPNFEKRFGGWDSLHDNIDDNEFVDTGNKLKEFGDHHINQKRE